MYAPTWAGECDPHAVASREGNKARRGGQGELLFSPDVAMGVTSSAISLAYIWPCMDHREGYATMHAPWPVLLLSLRSVPKE